jgi:1-acyl-sn-glycerol-3-phosphate acyltransferase
VHPTGPIGSFLDGWWSEDGDPLYALERLLVVPIIDALAPGSACYGVERLPATGGAVVALNHLAAIDPPLVGSFCPRPLRCMAKAELLATPVAGPLIRSTGAFPVRRGAADRDALRTARRLAREGELVGVFAEGTRQRLGYPGPLQPGAAMIAIQEGLPVIPVGLETFGWSLVNRRACAMIFGEPIDLGGLTRNSRGYQDGSALIEAEIRRLWRQAAEALAAGLPPELGDGARRSGYTTQLARVRRNLRRPPESA